MNIRRLTLNDSYALKNLADSRKNIKGLIEGASALIIDYNQYWLDGMKKYYLVGNDTHYLYGCFHNNVLVSCMAWRCDLPSPWNDGWVVGHLKTRPGVALKKSGMVEIWRIMFEICEAKGLTRWHMLIPEGTRTGYQSVADKWFRDIDSQYQYDWSLIIPPNTKPDVDWVWGTMGRRLHNKEIRLRTGTKKCAQTLA